MQPGDITARWHWPTQRSVWQTSSNLCTLYRSHALYWSHCKYYRV